MVQPNHGGRQCQVAERGAQLSDISFLFAAGRFYYHQRRGLDNKKAVAATQEIPSKLPSPGFPKMAAADEPVPSEGPLAELATSIGEEFRRCMEQKHLKLDDWVEVRTSDFNLWVAGVGAAARNRASLDARLHALPDMIPTLKRLLSSLKQSLASYRVSEGEQERDSSKEVVDMVIENLAMLATVIRQTGRRSRFKKADQMFDPKRQERFYRHLECIVRLRPTEDGLFQPVSQTSPDWLNVTSYRLEEGRALTQLQKRLIQANLRRRYWFLYAQRHSEKLAGARPSEATQTTIPMDAEQASFKVEETAASASPGAPRPQLPHRQGGKIDAVQMALTDISTKASTVESKIGFHGEDRKRNIALTTITSILAAAEYPRLAKPDQHGHNMRKIFKCPCCCQPLPATVYEDTQAWKYRPTFPLWHPITARSRATADYSPTENILQVTSVPTPALLRTAQRPTSSTAPDGTGRAT